jgi:hypothetical protein
LLPTSPPPTAFEPTDTAPVAKVLNAPASPVIVPWFTPASPPACMLWQPGLQLAGTLPLAVTLPVAYELLMIADV